MTHMSDISVYQQKLTQSPRKRHDGGAHTSRPQVCKPEVNVHFPDIQMGGLTLIDVQPAQKEE